MNLRHIDPRSTDWMDAMLEGELDRKRKPEVEEPVARDAEGVPVLVGGKAALPESLGSPPRVHSR